LAVNAGLSVAALAAAVVRTIANAKVSVAAILLNICLVSFMRGFGGMAAIEICSRELVMGANLRGKP
jgi:hypothetical protein